MTDTTHEAPERIWFVKVGENIVPNSERTSVKDVEYVRADRIEELEAERKKTYEALLKVTRIHEELETELLETQDRANAFATKEYYTEMRAKAAEAKLAKAVEAVWEEYQDSVTNKWTFRKEHISNAISRTTLAELKGKP